MAWTGRFDTETCTYHDQKIWSASGYDGTESSIGASMCIGVTGDDAAAGNEVRVYRLDGQTGEVEDDVLVDGVACSQRGPYGMAADGDGNVWVSFFDSGELVRVDGSTLEVEIHSGANYGITVDSLDRPWRNGGSAGYFDRDTDTWTLLASTGGGGLAEDHRGRMWAVAPDNNGMIWIDIDDGSSGTVTTPGSPWGVSVDIDGFIWGVGSASAHRLDPDTLAVESRSLGGYTYSDMTGGQIVNVSCPVPPQG